ncbi:hypothetical protein M406DRAFT_320398 [Cryphonectria parasitica EP155]|uniref:Uncharacterized protein n=1 Tax=Cryphonectria parasitica (strain ATCC 38755 / EP155) TaxID=660469 RepID=A0A9P4YCB6_CRYP1|nr:uncharacterized protein M406DRAFT_320398 [Cryphonectria parasitica EP155]KAF3770468.1 hypothetical protein M406DRAFT_320398 [Cryphonectria parasitica EP155]
MAGTHAIGHQTGLNHVCSAPAREKEDGNELLSAKFSRGKRGEQRKGYWHHWESISK